MNPGAELSMLVAVDKPGHPPGQDRGRVLKGVAPVEQTRPDRLGHQSPRFITGARHDELAPRGRGSDPVLKIPAS